MKRKRRVSLVPERKELKRPIRETQDATEMEQTSLAPGPVVTLQQSLGNRAVQRMLAAGHLGSAVRHSTPRNFGMGAHVQREDEQAGDAAQAGKGTITIQKPKHDTYTVGGATLAKVAAKLEKREGWGHCDWDYDCDPATVEEKIVTKVDVTLALGILLPEWTGKDDASEASQAEWDRMMGALKTHEQGHVDIAKRGAETLQERLLYEREGDFDAVEKQVCQEIQGLQDDYDVETEHGVKQGVTLTTNVDELQGEEEEEAGLKLRAPALDIGI